MEEYLMKYGFSGNEFGINNFLNAERSHQKNESPRQKQNYNTDFSDTKLKNLPLAMAYVPMQRTLECYETDTALKTGTLFPELDKPFLGKRI